MNQLINIPAIQDWRSIFVDTSFIINSLANLSLLKQDTLLFNNVKNTQALLEYYKQPSAPKVRWIVSSITASELTKFTDDVVDGISSIFMNGDLEIVNFTIREANFILKDFTSFIENRHFEEYKRDFQKQISSLGVFNPKAYLSSDARIIACAKSKRCDVVLTSDEKSFYEIAKVVQLPVILSSQIPLDMYNNIDTSKAFTVNV